MKRTIDVNPTVQELAEYFAYMSDEDQAQFFVEVAKEMGTWAPFKRDLRPKGMFETNRLGNLAHKNTGETDFKKYASALEKWCSCAPGASWVHHMILDKVTIEGGT